MTLINGEQLPSIVGQIDSLVRPGLPLAVVLPPNLIPQSETLGGRYFPCSLQHRRRYRTWRRLVDLSAPTSLRLRTPTAGARRPLAIVSSNRLRRRKAPAQMQAPRQISQEPLPASSGSRSAYKASISTWMGHSATASLSQPLPHNLLLLVDVRDGPALVLAVAPIMRAGAGPRRTRDNPLAVR